MLAVQNVREKPKVLPLREKVSTVQYDVLKDHSHNFHHSIL